MIFFSGMVFSIWLGFSILAVQDELEKIEERLKILKEVEKILNEKL